MYNKKLAKIYAGCALSMALAMAVTPINAFAAEPAGIPKTEVNKLTPGTNQTDKDAKAAEEKTRTKLDPTAEGYTNTDIDVWGYTEDRTVYSVDVEWGAMTFQYEASTWNPDDLTSVEGRGWQVYNNVSGEVLLNADDTTDVQDAINRITVTNHSNAPVKATLTYTGEATYGVTSGTFTGTADGKKTATNTAEDYGASFADGVITLETANNSAGGTDETSGKTKGKATVGNVYFMPSGIKTESGTPATIEQWKTIGKITVSLAPVETPAEGGTN